MHNKIYCEDCILTMKRMPHNIIDLIITSPPYDNLRKYHNFNFDFKNVAKELFRVLKNGGVLVWVVGDATVKGSETGTSFRQVLYFKKVGFNLHDTMIYQKDNPPPVGGSNRYFQHFEYMFVLSKGNPKTFNPIKRKRRNKYNDKRTERIKVFTRDADGNFIKKKVSLVGDVKIGNIWKYVVGGGNSVPYGVKHPAAFPEKLVSDHILTWSNRGDLIYDPFMGSGTTAVTAKKLGRSWRGSEVSQEYCTYADKRIKERG